MDLMDIHFALTSPKSQSCTTDLELVGHSFERFFLSVSSNV